MILHYQEGSVYDSEGVGAVMKRSKIAGAVIMLLPFILLSGSVSASGLFNEDPDWVYHLSASWWCNLISANLNTDSIPDMVLGDLSKDQIQTFIGNGDGSFDLFQSVPLTNPIWLETSDVDLDGDLDVVVMCEPPNDGYIFTLLNDGTGNLSNPISNYIDAAGENFVVALFDIDTIPDIVLGNYPGNVYYSHGNGDGTFETAGLIYDENCGAYALDVADLDSDGDLDIVLLAWERLSVLFNDGDGTVTWGGYYGPYAGPFPAGHITLAHLDNDEFLDVALTAGVGMGANTVFTFLGNGDGSFDITGPGWLGGIASFTHVIAEDFDLDGYNDAFFCGFYLSIMLNSGDGLLINPMEFGSSAASRQGAVADFDSDGDFDFAYVSGNVPNFYIHVHLNKLDPQGVEGSGETSSSIELLASPSPFSSSLGITYSLPEPGHVELSIYDLSGRFMGSVENCWKATGTQATIWTPEESIPDGCYLVVLDACGEQVVRRCVKL